jgi:hypothetical protein
MPRIVRLIPERTIDAWTSSAVTDWNPHALIWAPAPPAQAAGRDQPWDFAVEDFAPPAKLLVLENKCLLGFEQVPHNPRVRLELEQFIRLLSLDALGLPVFYCLPGLGEADLPVPMPPETYANRAGLRLAPQFAVWHRALRPLELVLLPRVQTALLGGWRSVTLRTNALSGGRSLGDLLRTISACQAGQSLSKGDGGEIRPILPPLLPKRDIDYALRRTAATLSGATARLGAEEVSSILLSYLEPGRTREVRSKRARNEATSHLGRTIWVVAPGGVE